jgi:hypothetical protein
VSAPRRPARLLRHYVAASTCTTASSAMASTPPSAAASSRQHPRCWCDVLRPTTGPRPATTPPSSPAVSTTAVGTVC